MPRARGSLRNRSDFPLLTAVSVKSASVVLLRWDRRHGGLRRGRQPARERTHSASESGGCRQLLRERSRRSGGCCGPGQGEDVQAPFLFGDR